MRVYLGLLGRQLHLRQRLKLSTQHDDRRLRLRRLCLRCLRFPLVKPLALLCAAAQFSCDVLLLAQLTHLVRRGLQLLPQLLDLEARLVERLVRCLLRFPVALALLPRVGDPLAFKGEGLAQL